MTQPKERPIIMQPESIRAILAGTKTQTRRLATVQPQYIDGLWHALYPWGEGGHGIYETEAELHAEYDRLMLEHCPYGKPKDRLWVRESWGDGDLFYEEHSDPLRIIAYKADRSARGWSDATCSYPVPAKDCDTWNWDFIKWRSPLHMPRWASRLLLEVVSVRVGRLQEISEEDAVAEGISLQDAVIQKLPTARDVYRYRWDSINPKSPWASNPWVWVVEFRKVAP